VGIEGRGFAPFDGFEVTPVPAEFEVRVFGLVEVVEWQDMGDLPGCAEVLPGHGVIELVSDKGFEE